MTVVSNNLQQKIYDSIQVDIDSSQIESKLTIRELKIIESINQCIIELNKSNIKLLDVGCGAGKVSKHFADYCELYGIEISKTMADIATDNGIKVSSINIENEKYPFSDEYFDIILSGEVIEHLIEPDNYLYENNRVLKKGGYFIISFPNINQPISWISMILFDYPPILSSRYKSAHMRDYTLKIVKKILIMKSFEILNVRGSYIRPFKNILSQWLADIFSRYSEQIIIVSRKKMEAHKDERNVIWDMRDI
jgi:SAM-dependent methyltransferase